MLTRGQGSQRGYFKISSLERVCLSVRVIVQREKMMEKMKALTEGRPWGRGTERDPEPLWETIPQQGEESSLHCNLLEEKGVWCRFRWALRLAVKTEAEPLCSQGLTKWNLEENGNGRGGVDSPRIEESQLNKFWLE